MMLEFFLVYFVLSAIVASFVASEEHQDLGKYLFPIILTLFGPIIALLMMLKNSINKIDTYLQVKTFWYYIFNRSKLTRTNEQLQYLKGLFEKKYNSKKVFDRLFIYAVSLIFKLNNYSYGKLDTDKG